MIFLEKDNARCSHQRCEEEDGVKTLLLLFPIAAVIKQQHEAKQNS
jgi:hypothetical protein